MILDPILVEKYDHSLNMSRQFLVAHPGGNLSMARVNNRLNKKVTEQKLRNEFVRIRSQYNMYVPTNAKNTIVRKILNNNSHVHPLNALRVKYEIAKKLHNRGIPVQHVLQFYRYLQQLIHNAGNIGVHQSMNTVGNNNLLRVKIAQLRNAHLPKVVEAEMRLARLLRQA